MKVLYIAWLRSRIGVGEEDLCLPAGIATVGELINWLKTRSPGHEAAFSDAGLVRAAVNQDYAGLDHPLRPGDEVAFFPPVTGG